MPAGAVVVGVEQSADARAALDYGLAEGRRRDQAVHVVTVYQPTERWLWGFAVTGAAPAGEEPDVDLAAVC